ncbi:formylmethanofuran dehydrogenase subunit B [Archaeoglobus veneficus]|nr:formylmethanofuran dehydrogenase subunit B [Archaeoglobus veneficus]
MRVEAFVCPFCGALCDDIIVETGNNGDVKIENACVLGTRKIMARTRGRITKPMIGGKEVSIDEAIERAAEILVNAKKPLLYGFSSTSCEAHSAGIELAELVGGVVDCTSSVCHGPTILAIHEVGVPSVTLGEVKNRADLIIYWGCNPMHAHPRHMSRYSTFQKGRFRKGRISRKVVAVDVRPTESTKLADEFIQVEPNRDFEIFNAMRAILNSGDCRGDVIGGVPKEKLKKLVEEMKSCQFGVIFFGMGLTHTYGNYRNVREAILLVRDLNMYTKFAIIPMRGHYNVTGFNEVCTWQTGYPYAVDFTRDYPWYNPGETDANSLLIAEDVDAMLVIAADPAAHFPKQAVEYMKRIPLVVIDPFESLTSKLADVVIPAAIAGVEVEGSAYRMDGVPLRLKKVFEPPEGVLSDEEILKRIISKVKEFL